MRTVFISLVSVGLLLSGGFAVEPLQEAARVLAAGEAGIGRRVADLEAEDVDGKVWRLRESVPKSRVVVVAFTSPTCPLSAKQLPALAALEKEFADAGVAFVYVNPVASDSEATVAESRRVHGLAGRYVRDAGMKVAGALGAASTTEVFVIDAARTLTYRGAVDDQHGIGFVRESAGNRWLRDAVQDTLAGRRPQIGATTAPGCVLELPQRGAVAASEVTWHGRVSRLVQVHCQECHRDGGIGPFPLVTMDDMVSHAGMVRKVVTKGLMPPWFAARGEREKHSPFVNDRSLPESDRADLLAWLDGGKPEGDVREAPLPRQWADAEWMMGRPDVVYGIPREIEVKATGKMGYVYQVVETGLTEDRWVQALEVLPSARAQVHHVLVFVMASDADRRRVAGGDNFFAAYVPGSSSVIYPEGYAKKLPKGSKLLFQLHYTPTGVATVDRTRLGLRFAEGAPRHEVMVAAAKNVTFAIPPGASDHVERAVLPVPFEADVLAFMPHMHVRGKSFRYELAESGGGRKLLLDVPRYDFNWQLLYRLAEPLRVKAGSRIEVTAAFDNSSGNPANPDPGRTVRWGEQTDQEMLLGYLEYVVASGEAKASASEPLRLTGKALGLLGRRLDRDGDGRVSVAEAGSGFAELHTRLDADRDGYVTREEAQRAAQERRAAVRP
jgi:peroxiredoxin